MFETMVLFNVTIRTETIEIDQKNGILRIFFDRIAVFKD